MLYDIAFAVNRSIVFAEKSSSLTSRRFSIIRLDSLRCIYARANVGTEVRGGRLVP